MVPYIAALVVLIVAILLAVYKRVDPFEILDNVNSEDLYDAVASRRGHSSNDSHESSTDSSTDSSGNPVASSNCAPSGSITSTKEMESRIAKSVAKQIKDTLLQQRSVDSTIQDTSCPYAQYDSTAQGQEYVEGKRSPQPDMSEYVRKDSIPCWNCSLP